LAELGEGNPPVIGVSAVKPDVEEIRRRIAESMEPPTQPHPTSTPRMTPEPTAQSSTPAPTATATLAPPSPTPVPDDQGAVGGLSTRYIVIIAVVALLAISLALRIVWRKKE